MRKLKHKDLDALKQFTQVAFKAAGEEFVMELTDIQSQAQLDAALFQKP
jgi:hypothetical protein